MKKKNIIKSKEDFDRIIHKRNGISTKFFIINSEKSNEEEAKFGITFVKKIGKAVTRNKIKRRIKSIIDNNDDIYSKGTNYIIIAKKETVDLKYKELEKQLILTFEKIK